MISRVKQHICDDRVKKPCGVSVPVSTIAHPQWKHEDPVTQRALSQCLLCTSCETHLAVPKWVDKTLAGLAQSIIVTIWWSSMVFPKVKLFSVQSLIQNCHVLSALESTAALNISNFMALTGKLLGTWRLQHLGPHATSTYQHVGAWCYLQSGWSCA